MTVEWSRPPNPAAISANVALRPLAREIHRDLARQAKPPGAAAPRQLVGADAGSSRRRGAAPARRSASASSSAAAGAPRSRARRRATVCRNGKPRSDGGVRPRAPDARGDAARHPLRDFVRQIDAEHFRLAQQDRQTKRRLRARRISAISPDPNRLRSRCSSAGDRARRLDRSRARSACRPPYSALKVWKNSSCMRSLPARNCTSSRISTSS